MFSQVHIENMVHMSIAYHLLYQNVELNAWKQSMQSNKIIKTASNLFIKEYGSNGSITQKQFCCLTAEANIVKSIFFNLLCVLFFFFKETKLIRLVTLFFKHVCCCCGLIFIFLVNDFAFKEWMNVRIFASHQQPQSPFSTILAQGKSCKRLFSHYSFL